MARKTRTPILETHVTHSSPESGPNPKVNNHPESIWNMVWLFMPVEKKPI